MSELDRSKPFFTYSETAWSDNFDGTWTFVFNPPWQSYQLEPHKLEAKVIKNNRGTSEVTINVGYASETMLVPEARRFLAQLSEVIKQAERDNKPRSKHPWE